MSFFDTIKQWSDGFTICKDWLGDGGIPVETELAQRRADVCTGLPSGEKCPHNVSPISIEHRVAEGIKKVVELKNHLQLRVKGEKTLKTCDVCGCHLPTKVHVPLPYLLRHTEPEELAKFPAFCWMKTEQPKAD